MTVDVTGEVVSVTVTEPRFTVREKEMLLASRREPPRGRHGMLMSEALDPANQFAFEAVGPSEDFAQSAINKAEAEYEKHRPKDDHRSIVFGVRKRA